MTGHNQVTTEFAGAKLLYSSGPKRSSDSFHHGWEAPIPFGSTVGIHRWYGNLQNLEVTLTWQPLGFITWISEIQSARKVYARPTQKNTRLATIHRCWWHITITKALMVIKIMMYSVICIAPRTSGNHRNHASGRGSTPLGTLSCIHANASSFKNHASPWKKWKLNDCTKFLCNTVFFFVQTKVLLPFFVTISYFPLFPLFFCVQFLCLECAAFGKKVIKLFQKQNILNHEKINHFWFKKEDQMFFHLRGGRLKTWDVNRWNLANFLISFFCDDQK